jgi:hypothetical protein
MTTATLLDTLSSTTMLEIDGLHAWDFSLDEAQLLIQAVDGRDKKIWKFTLAQVAAATFDPQLQSWVLTDGSADHRLVCLDAFSPSEEDDAPEEE